MQRPIQIKSGLPFFPTLQYSSPPRKPAPVPAKPFNSELAQRTRFSMLNKRVPSWGAKSHFYEQYPDAG